MWRLLYIVDAVRCKMENANASLRREVTVNVEKMVVVTLLASSLASRFAVFWQSLARRHYLFGS